MQMNELKDAVGNGGEWDVVRTVPGMRINMEYRESGVLRGFKHDRHLHFNWKS